MNDLARSPALAKSTELLDGRGYPRPQLVRSEWLSLNGDWDFAFDPDARAQHADDIAWQARIRVPFAPETAASGINNTGFYRVCWYRREFSVPEFGERQRILIHFGAIDFSAKIWVNNIFVGEHIGGYTPFTLDVTDALHPENLLQTIIVRAEDDPIDLSKPRGKQDWQLRPHAIWYPRTTGIWQTVWLERVPDVRIGRLRWQCDLVAWSLTFEAWLVGERREDLRLELTLRAGGRLLAQDSYAVVMNEVHRTVALSDPGIDDSRNELLWSPERPRLIHGELRLVDGQGVAIDEVSTYTALRAISMEGDRVVLNGRPYPLRLILDQGYWKESGQTAPDDAALRHDVELAKAMGFNGVRKHQKIEDPRYLYWADHLGLLVWEEMPSAYRFNERAVDRVMREWTDAMRRDFSHPCIIAWVPINESWGVPNLPHNPVERHYVRSLYHLTKVMDPTRLVIGNDGWESVATDIIGIHDYEHEPRRLAIRYQADRVPRLLKQERPGGRLLYLGKPPKNRHPVVLSEFGGIALNRPNTWGYTRCETPEDFERQYCDLLAVVRNLGILAGFCYTQFADTYQEANGLLYADRTPKFPIHRIRAATVGDGWRP